MGHPGFWGEWKRTGEGKNNGKCEVLYLRFALLAEVVFSGFKINVQYGIVLEGVCCIAEEVFRFS
jgi:hypothetical protein